MPFPFRISQIVSEDSGPKMKNTYTYPHVSIIAMSLALVATQLSAQDYPLTPPGTPVIKLLNEVPEEVENIEAVADNNEIESEPENITPGTARDILLADENRIGYGAAATGGTNIVEVKTETEFFNALQTSDNYVLISPSLANTTFTRNEIFATYANNITIDGSLAPGFKIKVGTKMPRDGGLFRIFGDNVIIHNIEGEGIDFLPPKMNQSFLNIFGENIWIDKVTATGFNDDFVNILLDCDFITVSRIRTYDTDKSVMVFNPDAGQSDTRLTVHSSWMASSQRPPLVSSGYAHSFNNYVEVATLEVGRNTTQAVAINHYDPAYLISENNVYDNQRYNSMIATAANPQNNGYIQSVNDNLNGNERSAVGNVTYNSKPSLFAIPYNYSSVLKPTADVVKYVQANAGADR